NFENDYAISADKLSEYIETIESLKEKYKGKIEIYNGIELDSDYESVDKSKFDFVIASVHQLHCGEKIYSIDNTAAELSDCVKNEFGGSWNAMAKQYYSSVSSFVCKIKPDVVGHFDLIGKFNDNAQLFEKNNVEYKLITKTYLDRICYACPDTIFEVNTGAMFRQGNKSPYPDKFILKHLCKMGMKITITSDAHSTDSLDFAFDEAARYCKDCGYKTAYALKNGRFVEYDL
ncbi:MAG: histidinol-phosphatase HisJ family protein, partial [Acutalibacteraceae bacterium]